MHMQEKYYIFISGVKVPVSKELYDTYYKMERRFRYYEHDIKVGRVCKKDGKEVYLPSKEDSYDRLAEFGLEPSTQFEETFEQVILRLRHQQLMAVLQLLSEEEFKLLYEIFWNDKSERQLSKQTGIPQKTINDRKHKILKKLKQQLQNIDR